MANALRRHALKRTLGITVLFLLAAAAWGQVSAPSVSYVSSAPSGACSQSPPVQVLNSSGAIYTCNNGTWAVQGGGSGSGTVSDGAGTTTANQLAVSTGTAHTQGYAAPSTLPQTVAWEKRGTVIFGGNVDSTVVQEPTVFVQPNPVVLTNLPTGVPVLGMFYTQGFNAAGLGYAESVDGGQGNWFGSSIYIPNHAHSCEATIGGIVYVLAGNGEPSTGIDIYSFASGTATLVKANLVTTSGASWKNSQLGNCGFWKDLDGHYYLFFDGYSVAGGWQDGVADCGTSAPSSGTTCTESANNPIIGPFTAGGTMGDPKSIRQIGASSYEMWLHGTTTGVSTVVPTDGYFAKSTVAASSWNSSSWTVGVTAVLPRTSVIEGVNNAVGQIGDMSVLDFNGSCLDYYTQFPNGNTGINGGIGLAIANVPCNSLLNVTQEVQVPASTTSTLNIPSFPFIDNLSGSALSSNLVNYPNSRFAGTCTVSAGTIISTSATATTICMVLATGLIFPANQVIQAKMFNNVSSGVDLLFLNMTTTGTGVDFYFSGFGTTGMQYSTSGSFGGNLTTTPSTCGAPTNGDVVRFYNVGTTYTAYDVTSHTLLCTATASGYTGYPGVGVGATSGATGYIGPVVAD